MMTAAKDVEVVIPKYAPVVAVLLLAVVILDYCRYRKEPGGKQWTPIGMHPHAKTVRR